ncbi:hypothetical protein BVX99_02285, partial [bacterium F16]
NMFDHSVRAPFIVCGPGIKGNTKNDTPIYLQDMMPTTLELAGAQTDGVDFKSLNPLINGEKVTHYDSIYGAYLSRQRMISKDGFKLIHYPKGDVFLLFDLKHDPHEMNDLAKNAIYADKLAEMKTALTALQKEMGDPLE